MASAKIDELALPVRALVLDDDPTTVAVLTRILSQQQWEVQSAQSIAEARTVLSHFVPEVAIVDVYIGSEDGLAFTAELRKRIPEVGIVVISVEDTETLANKAIGSGADNFLSKPIVPAALLLAAGKLAELRHERQRARQLERELQSTVWERVFPEIVTHSDAMEAVLRLIQKVGPRDLAVLVCGESGTGKELVAQAIHQISPRARHSFVELNCAALPPNLVESELFGHEKGSFTGAVAAKPGKIELAAGGTLFLDEIGELPLDIQPKLLRALQEKRITRVGGTRTIDCDFRLVSATNRDLAAEVKVGRFREDLFYRVAVFPVQLPALRDRMEDLDLLLAHFLKREAGGPTVVTPEARQLLHAYDWPGNVRELLNFAQAISLLSEGGHIDGPAVRAYFGSRFGAMTGGPVAPTSLTRPVRTLKEVEREEILYALRHFHGNVGEAARALGMGRATLYKFMRLEGIEAAELTSAKA
ncbi:MAG: sigma-54 dependent transcriptional regulator [Candidatus Sumerlaeaceae bacterium]|nr:sigma-54 dependent transcriptional regulator [Candidatus Sumerlaeaceae bacterium]